MFLILIIIYLDLLINIDIKKNFIIKFKKSNVKGNYKMEFKNFVSKKVFMIYYG